MENDFPLAPRHERPQFADKKCCLSIFLGFSDRSLVINPGQLRATAANIVLLGLNIINPSLPCTTTLVNWIGTWQASQFDDTDPAIILQ